MTQVQLAELLGVTERAIQMWYTRNPEYAAALDKSREQYNSDPEFFERIARHQAMEALLVGCMMEAKSRDDLQHKRQCMKELLSQTNHLQRADDKVDFSAYTDKELMEMALSGDIDTGYSKEELEKALEAAK